MSESIAAFLERIGALGIRHSGRSLHDHLRGTERLLRDWNCEESTCLAGLFHSIYGTNAFRQSTLDIGQRAVLVELIGAQAESRAYLFHACDRPGALIDALHTGGVVNRLDGQFITLDDADLARLIEVECANLLEQRAGKRFFSMLVDALKSDQVEISADATLAITRAST